MGFDFLEFEFQQTGKLRYLNSTKYKNEAAIEKTGASQCGHLSEVTKVYPFSFRLLTTFISLGILCCIGASEKNDSR